MNTKSDRLAPPCARWGSLGQCLQLTLRTEAAIGVFQHIFGRSLFLHQIHASISAQIESNSWIDDAAAILSLKPRAI